MAAVKTEWARVDKALDDLVGALTVAKRGSDPLTLAGVAAVIIRTRLAEAGIVSAHSWGAPSMMGSTRFAEVMRG